MSKKLNQLVYLIKQDLRLFLSISLGIFLFILFFQPFPLESFEDINNNLIFIAGIAFIIFVFMYIVRLYFHSLINKYDQPDNEPSFLTIMGGFIILALSSVALAFYLRYVGQVEISFFIMLKVVLICLTPPVIIRLSDQFNELKGRNDSLIYEKESILKKVEQYEEDYLNKTIEFTSEYSNENLILEIAVIAVIKSANNYVEIIYKEDGTFKKKLIRNTLKSIEQLIKHYSVFIRCHRTCIINSIYIEKLNSKFNNYTIEVKGYNEYLPVSRQYLLKLKEILA